MLRSKSFRLFLLLATFFVGWQMFDQRDAIAAVVGLPGSLKISAEDQYICS